MCSCSRIKGRVMMLEREWNAGVKWLCFFSRALTLIYSQHLVLAHILSPSLSQTNPRLSGYVWTVVSERTTDSWPLDKEVHYPEHGALILSSTDEQKFFWLPQVASSLLRPQGMSITIISDTLFAKWQLSTQMYVNMLYIMLEKYCWRF